MSVSRMHFSYLDFTACQDYFTHFEPSHSLGGAKTGDPREKTPDHPKQNLACLICEELGLNPQQRDDEPLRVQKINILNHSAMECLLQSSWNKDIIASWENLFMPYANNKGADQPAHLSSLISTFIIHCLDSVISVLAIDEI